MRILKPSEHIPWLFFHAKTTMKLFGSGEKFIISMKGVKITFTQQVFSSTKLDMSNCNLPFTCSDTSVEALEEGVKFGQTK